MKQIVIIPLIILASLVSSAQITLDQSIGDSTSTSYTSLVTIDGETKMFTSGTDQFGRRIYNVVDFAGNQLSQRGLLLFPYSGPTLPPAHHISYFHDPIYITTNLFDTDAGIEMIIEYSVSPDSAALSTSYKGFVICDWVLGDTAQGTVDDIQAIFQVDSLDGPWGWEVINGRDIQIINTDHGTKMILNKWDKGIEIYSLPGTLDCPNYCDNNSIVTKTNDLGGIEENELEVYPNPSNGRMTVEYEAPQGIVSATLHVIDMNGAIVLTQPIQSNAKEMLNLSHVPSGSYLIRVVSDGLQPKVLATKIIKL